MKTTNIINVGKLMRSECECRVSQDAVDEVISYLKASIPSMMVTLTRIAKADKRNTIMENDVIHLFSRVDNGVIPND